MGAFTRSLLISACFLTRNLVGAVEPHFEHFGCGLNNWVFLDLVRFYADYLGGVDADGCVGVLLAHFEIALG